MTVDIKELREAVLAKACERCTEEGLDVMFTPQDFRSAHPDIAPGHVDLAVSMLIEERALFKLTGSGVKHCMYWRAYKKHVGGES